MAQLDLDRWRITREDNPINTRPLQMRYPTNSMNKHSVDAKLPTKKGAKETHPLAIFSTHILQQQMIKDTNLACEVDINLKI